MKIFLFRYLVLLSTALAIVLAISALSKADEVGIRLNSAISPLNNDLVQFPSGGDDTGGYYDGKMINAFYDWEPGTNFYLEGALGYRSYSDIFQYSSADYELSPGLRVEPMGWLVLKLSEGLAYMPQNTFNTVTQVGYKQFDFVTHLTIGFKDPISGIGVYLDRSHYSNGNAVNNPSLNYAGFMIAFPIGGGTYDPTKH